jgi:S-DNA-T family DNA segregation ATPase FtsK/SpoIIIE
MARNKDRKKERNLWGNIKTETVQAVLAIISFILALLALLASLGKAGPVGSYIYAALDTLLGVGYFLLPILFLMLGGSFLRGLEKRFEASKIVGSLLFFISALGLIDMFPGGHGGILGHFISSPLIRLFGPYATALLLVAGVAISILIIFETHFTLESLMFWKKFGADAKTDKKSSEVSDKEAEKILEAVEGAALAAAIEEKKREKKAQPVKAGSALEDDGMFAATVPGKARRETASGRPFVPPPLSLLEKDSGKPETGDIKANANIIKRTLQNFGIDVEMDEISIGPSVTRYALKPAEGVKLSKIVALNNDLALALAAHPIRIEAPIPGKSLVGIEIPNSTKTTVGLATLLSSEEYQKSDKPLLISLGKGVTGKSYFSNLAKAPHMLIAGATGSGKSVTIHAVVNSLLFRNSPENLKFIMIDPKRVELTLYNNIPHLLTPVITDPKKAILSLKWAAKEMSRRYDVLEKNKVRDIDSYHKAAAATIAAGAKQDDIPETMPYIVIVIDELADIMQTYPRELESAIVRLAQMSRAIGIHLIISTQRPSVNVITGLIKANIPTRVALQVSSQIDSRTILDGPGAEKLLGAGDMLYLGGEMAKPARLQSAFISENEVKKVVKYLASEYKDEVMGEINLTNTNKEPSSDAVFSANLESDGDIGDEDDMYEPAKEAVISAGKASTSYIQRKLGVGYSRAARLMDMLEEKGVIGPANGSKPREVIGGSDGDTVPANSAIDSAEGESEGEHETP